MFVNTMIPFQFESKPSVLKHDRLHHVHGNLKLFALFYTLKRQNKGLYQQSKDTDGLEQDIPRRMQKKTLKKYIFYWTAI